MDMGRKLGVCPFREGRWVPSNTMSPRLRLTSVPNGILMHTAVWPQQTWAKSWWGCAHFLRGELGPHLAQCSLGRGLRPYQVASWFIQPLGHNRNGLKIGGSTPFLGRGAGSPSNTKSPGLRPTSAPSGILIHPAVWPQRTWTENGGCAPLGAGELDPHLRQCGRGQGLPASQVSSWSIQPFGHSTQTYRQTERPGRTGQRSDSIRQSVLQTVTHK